MRVLIIDSATSPDEATLRTLYLRGYDVTTLSAEAEALERIRRAAFDCILVGVPESGVSDFGSLTKIRQLAMVSAVALVTAAPVESFMKKALAEGSIEVQAASDLMATVGSLDQPALVVGSDLQPAWIQEIRDRGLRACSTSTLQFAMNLLVDGWCQVVLLEADIPGLTHAGSLATFHEINAPQMVILASAAFCMPPGIVLSSEPHTVGQFVSLFEQMTGNRHSPCGWTEHVGKRNFDAP